MNGINKITGQIDADIQSEIDALMDQTRAQADEIAGRYEAQAGQEAGALLERGRAAAAEHEDRLVSTARLVVTRANDILGEKGHLTLAEGTRNIRGGIILEGDRVEVNCSFEALIRAQKESETAEVARILFGSAR